MAVYSYSRILYSRENDQGALHASMSRNLRKERGKRERREKQVLEGSNPCCPMQEPQATCGYLSLN